MLNSIYLILIHTPVWVYVLFAYLMFVGFKATKPRAVPLKKLVIMPAIFAMMSLHTLTTSFELDITLMLCWLVSLTLGAALGWWQVCFGAYAVDKKMGLIKMPGSWSVIIMILLIFATKYYFGYQMAIDPELKTNTHFEIMMLSVSGIITGMFIGKFIFYYSRFKVLPQTDLT